MCIDTIICIKFQERSFKTLIFVEKSACWPNVQCWVMEFFYHFHLYVSILYTLEIVWIQNFIAYLIIYYFKIIDRKKNELKNFIKNDISLEVRRCITLANRCYFGLRKQLSKKALSWRTKICLYKSFMLPVLLYGAETWMLTFSDEQALAVFERKILRKIYGLFCDRGEWRIRWNQQLYDIYDDIDVVKRIKI